MSVDVWVDFNESDASGNVFTLEKFAEVSFVLGDRLLAGDDEGNTCWGVVVELDGGVVALRLDLDTFSSAPVSASTSIAR